MTILRGAEEMSVPEPWDPWATLKALGNVQLEYQVLTTGEDGFVERYASGRWRIVLDSRLNARQQRCVLGHELTHVARGQSVAPWLSPILEAVEESQVDIESAVRLLPPAILSYWALDRLSSGLAVTVEGICDRFDVEPDVALLAMAVISSPWLDTVAEFHDVIRMIAS